MAEASLDRSHNATSSLFSTARPNRDSRHRRHGRTARSSYRIAVFRPDTSKGEQRREGRHRRRHGIRLRGRRSVASSTRAESTFLTLTGSRGFPAASAHRVQSLPNRARRKDIRQRSPITRPAPAEVAARDVVGRPKWSGALPQRGPVYGALRTGCCPAPRVTTRAERRALAQCASSQHRVLAINATRRSAMCTSTSGNGRSHLHAQRRPGRRTRASRRRVPRCLRGLPRDLRHG